MQLGDLARTVLHGRVLAQGHPSKRGKGFCLSPDEGATHEGQLSKFVLLAT